MSESPISESVGGFLKGGRLYAKLVLFATGNDGDSAIASENMT